MYPEDEKNPAGTRRTGNEHSKAFFGEVICWRGFEVLRFYYAFLHGEVTFLLYCAALFFWYLRRRGVGKAEIWGREGKEKKCKKTNKANKDGRRKSREEKRREEKRRE